MNHTFIVYHHKQKIIFSTGKASNDQKAHTASLKWKEIADFLRSDKSTLRIQGPEPARLFRLFSTFFECVPAAGGIVENIQGHWLFIFRNGRWDLPKGMVEPGENPEDTALREVKEECGIRQVAVKYPLPVTYHIYPLTSSGLWALKKTKWFMMGTQFPDELRPQREEGISHLAWKDPEQLREVFDNTYENIKELVRYCQRIRTDQGED
ncbi:MAG: NUDIX hydrolase [Bacteroidales bacterium]